MIPPLQIDLSADTRALVAAAPEIPARLTRNLVRALDKSNDETVGHIVENRATGHGPFPVEEHKLGVVTSRYRRSVRPAKAIVVGTAIESAIGSNVRYAGAHEFGLDQVVQVKAHQAKNAWLDVYQTKDGRQIYGWERTGAGRATRVATGVAQVRAHPMHMRIPARAPIRHGIEDRLPNYREALDRAVVVSFNPSAP